MGRSKWKSSQQKYNDTRDGRTVFNGTKVSGQYILKPCILDMICMYNRPTSKDGNSPVLMTLIAIQISSTPYEGSKEGQRVTKKLVEGYEQTREDLY